MSRSDHHGCNPQCGVCKPWKKRGQGKEHRMKGSDLRRYRASEQDVKEET